ncbi:uncharacterized protein LOC135082470 [Ostrinia nubilalis]|uniref:uncharacterized protein LOC135082470 n=1 Tax=Ostrinia nubilalis TaxID=29057 RepID=UPI0030822C34
MEWRLSRALLVPCASLLKHLPAFLTVSRPAVTLSYKIIGDSEMDVDDEAPPFFLLHGLLGCKRHWEGLGKTLLNMTKRSVVVVDQRNHGDSPHSSSHRYEEMAEDVVKLLDKLAVDRACFVGHSMGGRTCMCMSLIAPEKVAALLVVDISPISSPPHLTEYLPKVLNAMKAVEFKRPKTVNKARKMAKRQLKKVITDDMIMRAVLSNINIKSDSTIGWTCNLDALIENFEHIASFPAQMKGKKYRGPTLFVGGQLSDFIPPDDLTKIRGFFPQAVVHYVPKTGHNVHVEDSRAFLEFVLAFFKNIKCVTQRDNTSHKIISINFKIRHGMEITLRTLRYTGFLLNHVKGVYFNRRSAVNLAYKLHGKCSDSATPVIVLHGLLGSKRNWDSMSKSIASKMNTCVIAADLRNHGESPHDSSHAYVDLAEDVGQLIETIPVNKATIIGHSMGGRTGMVFALTKPDKVASLVVVDISPVSTAGILNNFFPRLIDAMKSVSFEGLNNVTAARNAAKEKILASGVVSNMEGMHFILMNITTRPDKTVGWACNLDALKNSFNSIASFPNNEMENKTYNGPTLFIGGKNSNYIPPNDITGIKQYFPKADLKYIPGVGHNVHAEDPSSFLRMVTEFLAKK